MDLHIVILAAGQGTRMKSARPKVLHRAAGLPMIEHVLATAAELSPRTTTVVVGHGADALREALSKHSDLTFVVQEPQLGTGHALMTAEPALAKATGTVVLLYADVPALPAATVKTLVNHHVERAAAATVLTAIVDKPSGYGRIVRSGERIARIVEERDASPAERDIREINSGIYAFAIDGLFATLRTLSPANAQREYYLTDLVGIFGERGKRVETVIVSNPDDIRGVNSRSDLAAVSRVMRERKVTELMASGVTIEDPATTYVDRDVTIGSDTIIRPGVSIEGRSTIGSGCEIHTGVRIVDSHIGERVTIYNHCVLTEARVDDEVKLGPFAHLRSGADVRRGARVGNFVELKKTVLGEGSKANHLAYLGDATIGEKVNIGAGTITCNYDGATKNPTVIEDGAFIGSDSQLIAPVTIGKGAYVGSGTTVREDVPAGSLAVSAGKQRTIDGWVEKKKGLRAKAELMCGIIGYIGPKEVVPVLIEGLRRLEYRGYDSAGVAVVHNGCVNLRRSAGKLSNLETVIGSSPLVGEYGVGHTRWATHGRPTEENAHPHRDCTGKIVVVHNGIIENYLDLKLELQSQGHKFVTETDTEIVAHLVEREMKDDGLENAVRRALLLMRGLFALVLISADDPEKIVTVRNGPPIVVGLGDGEFFVASDIPAILSHTRDVVFLGDEEMAIITARGVEFTDFFGRPVSKATQRVLWDPIMAEKAGYKHFMLKEIFEQPTAARETILGRVSQDSGKVFLEEMKISDARLAAIDRVTILACGTSWHAGLVGKFMIEQLARVHVDVDYGSEYRYRHPIVSDKALAVVITQSGETADTLAALREAKRAGASSISICNVVGSMATRETEGTIYTHAGPEIGVASTKAFTSQLVALYLLALRLGQVRGTLSADESRAHIDALLQLPQLLEQTLKIAPEVEEVAGRFHTRTDFLYLGRGINYPIALEGALKLKEISYIHAEGYPAGEMKHGPIALIDERMPVVTIAPQDHVFEKMIGNMQEVMARGGSVIALTSRGDTKLTSILDPKRDVVLEVPKTPDLLTPIVMALPLQLLAYDIAVRRGCDVDQPRNLAKSVTVE